MFKSQAAKPAVAEDLPGAVRALADGTLTARVL
jgi:hypothetical protein